MTTEAEIAPNGLGGGVAKLKALRDSRRHLVDALHTDCPGRLSLAGANEKIRRALMETDDAIGAIEQESQ